MKMMTCRQLGGACDEEFRASSFDDIASLSQQHGREMFRQEGPAHLEAMGRMQDLMKDPAAMDEWREQRRREFDALPDEQ